MIGVEATRSTFSCEIKRLVNIEVVQNLVLLYEVCVLLRMEMGAFKKYFA